MLRPNIIAVRRTVRVPTLVQRKDVFTFREHRKYPKLQKLCFWILTKLEAFYDETVDKIEHYTLDTNDFTKNIFAQFDEIKREFKMKPCRVFIGSREFSEIVSRPDFHQYFTFGTEYEVGQSVQDYDGRFRTLTHRCGVKVHVIPWMTGILVIPEER